ncbi:MAG: NADH-quinone oxidoreductase subunit H [Verrucomicrobia subdivision 3 bacterium]|nr:NADH-quinone oxidoreductase subunit H [Limisphaerales bacterium]MCS1415059.1 NADH-quinone oxidoreductase subunit H [Limisphaerales bacterium]
MEAITPPIQTIFWFGCLKVVCAVAVLLPMIAYSLMAERRISAAIQDRIGPNRVGPWGLLQPLADGLKFLLKEDFTPSHVRKAYFWLAPAITMIPAFLTIAVIPFGSTLGSQNMVIADLNVGILYTFSIVSLGVYGIVLAGYASNSKYPFLGGIRAGAQMISYEIAMGMSVIPLFMLVEDLNLGEVIKYQANGAWLIFKQPIAFVIFVAAAFAETNRLPFDLPESETELVSGYHTEYSSMKFALFFLGEYAAMIAVSALMVTLFLGGWTLPFFGLNTPATSIFGGLIHIGIFLGKVAVFMALFIWVRWMLPRFRYDQLMDLGWRRFLPLALVNIVITAVLLWIFR